MSDNDVSPELPLAEAKQPLPSSFLWGLPRECALSRGGAGGGKGSHERHSCGKMINKKDEVST